MAALVECRQLARVFDAGGQPFHALRGIDLQLAHGELVAIVGASGSGKSTLMNAARLPRHDRPRGDLLTLDGHSRVDATAGDGTNWPAIRNQKHRVRLSAASIYWPATSAVRNVELPMLYDRSWLRTPGFAAPGRDSELLTRVGLGERLDHGQAAERNCRGGQQQRVAIARALVTRTGKLILADEPTGNAGLASPAIEVMATAVPGTEPRAGHHPGHRDPRGRKWRR